MKQENNKAFSVPPCFNKWKTCISVNDLSTYEGSWLFQSLQSPKSIHKSARVCYLRVQANFQANQVNWFTNSPKRWCINVLKTCERWCTWALIGWMCFMWFFVQCRGKLAPFLSIHLMISRPLNAKRYTLAHSSAPNLFKVCSSSAHISPPRAESSSRILRMRYAHGLPENKMMINTKT